MGELQQRAIVGLLAVLAVAQLSGRVRAAENAAGPAGTDTRATLRVTTQALVDALAPG
jgi:hypothetical protein